MSKYNLEKALRRELEVLNDIIDQKIIKGLSYAKEARRHKFLLVSLADLRREEQRFNWLARSLNLVQCDKYENFKNLWVKKITQVRKIR